MSLAVLADRIAQKGRNGDSVLVHMSPDEVAGLHALALMHGEKLTINPETGLPEAFSLKRLLPMIIGAAVTYFSGGTIPAWQIAAGTGAVEYARTGDLGKGISAGLGAYGGASLATSFAAAGSAGVGSAAIETAQQEAMRQGLQGEAYNQFVQEAVAQKMGEATFGDRLAAGVQGLTEEKGREYFMNAAGGTSGLLKTGYAAASPMMADEMVQTATPMPGDQYQGTIRPYKFDPYTRTWSAQPTYPASPVKTEAETPPGGMAGGGIVALAQGGATETQIRDLYKDVFNREADEGGLKFWQQSGYTPEQIRAEFLKSDEYLNAPKTHAQLGAQAIPYAQGVRASREEIQDIYRDLLSREADVGGLDFYYASQFSPEQIRKQIRQSDEYLNRPVTPVPVVPGPTVPGVKGEDKVYGGTTKTPEYTVPQPQVTYGEPFKPTAPTMEQMRTGYEQGGGATRMPTISDVAPTDKFYSQNQAVSALRSYIQSNPGVTLGQTMTFARSQGIPEMQARAAYNELRFGTMTGDSQRAYEYLMGRAPYAPGTSGPVARPYAETMRVGQQRRYIPPPPSGPVAQSAMPEGREPTGVSATTGARNVAGGNASGAAGSFAALPGFAPTPNFNFNPETGEPYTPLGSGTELSELLSGKQDPSKVPVVSRDIYTPEYVREMEDLEREYDRTMADVANVDAIQRERDRIATLTPMPSIGSPGSTGGNKPYDEDWDVKSMARGGLSAIAAAAAARGGQFDLGSYSDGGRLLRGPGDGVSDSIPATIGGKRPARLADGEFVIPARIVSEIGNGSTEAGARKLYQMMERVQRARAKTVGKGRSKVAKNTRAEKYLPA